MGKMKIGLVGCGNIASDISRALTEKNIPATVVAVTDIDRSQAEALLNRYKLNASILDLEALAEAADFIVECAVGSVVPDVVHASIVHGKDCLIMSLGGLLADPQLIDRARLAGITLRLPSGAVCGLDGIRAAMQGGLDEVTLTTRKPPAGLKGAPYLVENNISVDGLTEALVVFEGFAREAVRAFPANVNVAAALSLAGIGPDKTRVRLIADPAATVNSHEIHAVGAFGEMTALMRNEPSPRNPKSSYMASLSACAEVAAAASAFVSGT
ncbi:MAG: aspartate dehydrogenase [Candidatus Hydrogenedens sp.]|jgi:aspartate dehydrogenase|nr:aspartate dehydrogenase [Candidatus Hydrogenedens sp.]